MKLRTDFVTNSSSSSFIIAVKTKTPLKDIVSSLNAHKKEFNEYLKDWKDCVGKDGEVPSYKEFLETLAAFLVSVSEHGITLDSWKAGAVEIGNDEFSETCVLYGMSSIDTPHLKVFSS